VVRGGEVAPEISGRDHWPAAGIRKLYTRHAIIAYTWRRKPERNIRSSRSLGNERSLPVLASVIAASDEETL